MKHCDTGFCCRVIDGLNAKEHVGCRHTVNVHVCRLQRKSEYLVVKHAPVPRRQLWQAEPGHKYSWEMSKEMSPTHNLKSFKGS